jgi:hypothetical protein
MTPELTKSIVGLLVPIMSFLGWNTSEYINLLPKNIQQEIIISEKKVEAIPQIDTTKTTENKSDTKSKSETKKTVTQNKKQPKYYPEPTAPTKKPSQKPSAPKINPVVTTTTETKTQKPSATVTTTPTEAKPKSEPVVVKTKTNLSIEEKIRQSTVNILCSRIIGNAIQKTTGSGVVIDSSGIILTNAHVAEYFLLAQNGNNTNCFIRTGSPAVSSYKAKLIYLPEIWIERNKNNLSMQTITGTGENDYALLAITERISASAPDAPLVYLSPSSDNLVKNQKIFIAGYPAGFSDVRILDSALYSLIKSSEVTNIAGFDGRSTDVINTSPTSVAEHGSSGGAVADEDGNLEALIVATTIDSYSGGKNIQAITLPYIRKSIQNNSGKSFIYFLENARDEVNNFEKNSVNNLAGILLGN